MRSVMRAAAMAIAAALAFAPPAAAADVRNPLAAPTRWAHEASDVAVDPAVRWGVLDNGLRYAILANKTPPARAAVRLRVGVGSLHESEDQRGLAHFLEHMAFNGSTNVPEGEMVKILERKGLAFGPDTNAYTSFDETVYMLDLPSVDADMLATALMLMRETAGELTLNPGAIERERGVIVAEERARATPGQRMWEAWAGFAMAGLRAPSRMPIGSMDVVREAGRDRFLALYQGYYRPENMFLAVVGDVDVDAVEAEIKARFATWRPAGAPGPLPDLGTPTAAPGAVAFFSDPNVPTIAWLTSAYPREDRPDDKAQRTRAILESLGAAMLNRRLERIARRAGAPFISATAGEGEWVRSARFSQLQVVSEPDKWREAMAAAEAEVRRALLYGFTDAEFAQEIANLRQSARTAAERAATRQSVALVNGLVASVANDSVFATPAWSLAFTEEIAPALTREAAWTAFKAAWGEAPPTVFLATKEPIPDAEAQIRAAFAAARAQPVSPPDAGRTLAFPYTDFGPPGRVVSRRDVPGLGATEVTFANNVRLVVKQTGFEEKRIRVQATFGRGLLDAPEDAPEVVGYASGAFMAGGLGALAADDLERALAGRAVGTAFTVGEDAFYLTGQTTPQDMELQLQLMTAYLADPGFRADGFARMKSTLDTAYRQMAATPGGVSGMVIPRALRSGDPRFGTPPRARMEAVTWPQVEAFLRPALQNAAVEVTIVGDIAPDRAIALVGATFAALPQRAPAPFPRTRQREVRFPDAPPAPITATHEGRPDQGLAMVAWPGIDFTNDRAARTVGLVEGVLGLKLLDELREKEGLTYSPSSSWSSSTVFPGYGVITASMELNPKDLATFYAAVDRIAAAMAAGDISADELLRARTPIVKGVEGGDTQNSVWMGRLAGGSFDPRVFARARTVLADYRAITLAEVRAMARRLLRPDAAVRFAITPKAAAPAAAP